MALGLNKLTGTVRHSTQTIALEGHDCGILIPHCPIAPQLNVCLAVIIPFSSRKMMFSASTVKADGTAIGTSDLLSTTPTPMMVCADAISVPVGFPVSNASNTVNVGMTAGDYVAGLAAIAASIVGDALGGGPGSVSSEIASKLGGFDAKKMGLGILTGVIKVIATGEGSIDIFSVGSPFGGFKISINVKQDGSWSVSAEGRHAHQSKAVEVGSDGSVTTTDKTDGFVGSHTEKETTAPDGSRTEEETEYDVRGETSTTTGKYDERGRLVELNGEPVDQPFAEPEPVDLTPEQAAIIGDPEPL
jgi:hypothetical protein